MCQPLSVEEAELVCLDGIYNNRLYFIQTRCSLPNYTMTQCLLVTGCKGHPDFRDVGECEKCVSENGTKVKNIFISVSLVHIPPPCSKCCLLRHFTLLDM